MSGIMTKLNMPSTLQCSTPAPYCYITCNQNTSLTTLHIFSSSYTISESARHFRLQGIRSCILGVILKGITFILVFVKIGQLVRKLKCVSHKTTEFVRRKTGDTQLEQEELKTRHKHHKLTNCWWTRVPVSAMLEHELRYRGIEVPFLARPLWSNRCQ